MLGTCLEGEGRSIDRYVLFDAIASGGMATVHLGRLRGSAGFTRTVAIKRLHPGLAKDPEFVSMFTDEARLAARMRHPNIVATLDVVSEHGELFLVMEYIHGESLARLLRVVARGKQAVPAPIAVAIAVGALTGLHAAHEATAESGQPLGVVHRDVSPQNIMIGCDGIARVLDFGVAKALGRLQVTREGAVKGKTAYMAPEQLRGEALDRRADVYAASVVLWEVLTGHRLFVADAASEVHSQILHADVQPPSHYASSVPIELDALVLRGLSRDPAQRFATALEMASALERTVLLPTPREVGAWVQAVATELLASRSEILHRIENTQTSATGPPGGFGAHNETDEWTVTEREPPRVTTTLILDAPRGQTPPGRGRSLRLLLAGLMVIVLCVFFGGTRLYRRAMARQKPTPTAFPAQLTEAQPYAAPDSASTPPRPPGFDVGSAKPMSSASPVLAETIPEAASTRASSAADSRTRRSPPRPLRPPASASSRGSPRNCDPPYVIDPDGIHIPKPECG